MKLREIKRHLASTQQISALFYLLKWPLLCAVLAALVGSASAFLLFSLEWTTNWRESHTWVIALLPLGGFVIGLTYHLWGERVVKGNNLLLEELHQPKDIIPFRMAPLVFFGTVLTHLFCGSAGREGTAVQVGGALADSLTKLLRLKPRDRKVLLLAGISAGFASVFGTPLAGAVFALEVLVLGRIRFDAIIPSFLGAILADCVSRLWHAPHTHYRIDFVPEMSPENLLWALLAGILFGLAALLFSRLAHLWSQLFQRKVKYPPLRPVIGGCVLAALVLGTGTTRYIGLGIPVIVDAFGQDLPGYDFLLKILFTTFTLGAGFKGGEVTPLFFVGATLGNALAWFVLLPVALLAGMGFVAVFSGATNTPIACTLMGMELFGAEGGVFIAIACITAYLFSGHTGIYTSQIVGSPKHLRFGRHKGLPLSAIRKVRKV